MKFTFLIIAFFISTVSFADNGKTCSVKKNGETIGYVTAYIREGKLYVSNDSDTRVTVEVKHCKRESNGHHDVQTTYVSVDAKSTSKPQYVGQHNEVDYVGNPVCN